MFPLLISRVRFQRDVQFFYFISELNVLHHAPRNMKPFFINSSELTLPLPRIHPKLKTKRLKIKNAALWTNANHQSPALGHRDTKTTLRSIALLIRTISLLRKMNNVNQETFYKRKMLFETKNRLTKGLEFIHCVRIENLTLACSALILPFCVSNQTPQLIYRPRHYCTFLVHTFNCF